MTPEFEKSILSSNRITKRCADNDYAYTLYSIISEYKLQKRSLNPFKTKATTDYSRRLAAAIISTIREEPFSDWYKKTPDPVMFKDVETDLKKEGWIVLNPDK